MSVTNSKVESAMNHRHLKEALRAPALTEQEFNAQSTVGAYIPSSPGRTQHGRSPVLKGYTRENFE